jgi:hypothetical protein
LKFANFAALKKAPQKVFSKKINEYAKFTKGQFSIDNPEFDHMFPTTRNSETQFRLLYTPLAQEQTVKLLKRFNDYAVLRDGRVSIVKSDSLTYLPFNIEESHV